MKNKLPEIGKKYKTKDGEIIEIHNYGIYYSSQKEGFVRNMVDYNFNYHFKDLEEVRDQEPEIPVDVDDSMLQPTGDSKTTYTCSCGNKIVLSYNINK